MTTRLLKSNVFDYIVCTAVMLFDFYSSQKSKMPCNKGKIYKRLNYVRLDSFTKQSQSSCSDVITLHHMPNPRSPNY